MCRSIPISIYIFERFVVEVPLREITMITRSRRSTSSGIVIVLQCAGNEGRCLTTFGRQACPSWLFGWARWARKLAKTHLQHLGRWGSILVICPSCLALLAPLDHLGTKMGKISKIMVPNSGPQVPAQCSSSSSSSSSSCSSSRSRSSSSSSSSSQPRPQA